MERREHASRAAYVQCLLELLTAHVDGLTLAELPSEIPTMVAGRILKPLAIRGLVKVEEDRWKPSPVLFAAARLTVSSE